MYDHYKEATELAMIISGCGMTFEASQILDPIKNGKSGTEIFMTLRFRMEPLLDAANVPEEAKGRLRILYSKIDQALK
jgi:hypothetical protein